MNKKYAFEEKKHNWEMIKEGFLMSDYTSVRSYLQERWSFTKIQIESGQTRRRLGSFRELEKNKIIQNVKKLNPKTFTFNDPTKYINNIQLNTKNKFLNTTRLAKSALYKSLFTSIIAIEGMVKDGTMSPLDIVKNAPNLKIVAEFLDNLEDKIVDESFVFLETDNVSNALTIENNLDRDNITRDEIDGISGDNISGDDIDGNNVGGKDVGGNNGNYYTNQKHIKINVVKAGEDIANLNQV